MYIKLFLSLIVLIASGAFALYAIWIGLVSSDFTGSANWNSAVNILNNPIEVLIYTRVLETAEVEQNIFDPAIGFLCD